MLEETRAPAPARRPLVTIRSDADGCGIVYFGGIFAALFLAAASSGRPLLIALMLLALVWAVWAFRTSPGANLAKEGGLALDEGGVRWCTATQRYWPFERMGTGVLEKRRLVLHDAGGAVVVEISIRRGDGDGSLGRQLQDLLSTYEQRRREWGEEPAWAAPLARNDQSLTEWASEIRAWAAPGSCYRQESVATAELLAVFLDVRHRASLRAAAAFAVLCRDDEDAHTRVFEAFGEATPPDVLALAMRSPVARARAAAGTQGGLFFADPSEAGDDADARRA